MAASTKSRPGQPRDRIIPTPNINPPRIAPLIEPVTAIIRAASGSNQPISRAPCTQTTAEENVSSHTPNRAPSRPSANSTVAARRQKADRCAAKPNSTPTISPISAAVGRSPIRSVMADISMVCSPGSARLSENMGIDEDLHALPEALMSRAVPWAPTGHRVRHPCPAYHPGNPREVRERRNSWQIGESAGLARQIAGNLAPLRRECRGLSPPQPAI